MLLSPALFAFEFHTVLVPRLRGRLRETIAVVNVCKTRSQLLFKRLRVANHLPGKAGECAWSGLARTAHESVSPGE